MSATTSDAAAGFEHEAFIYRDERSFLEGLVPFVADGEANGDAVLVALHPTKLELLRRALGPAAGGVELVDMVSVGRNPATIIPVWQRFVAQAAASGRAARGVGEPVWAGRTTDEITECHHHEALLNVAFAEGPPWQLICPYDAGALPGDVVERAMATHPVLNDGIARAASNRYVQGFDGVLEEPLPAPPADPARLAFDAGSLRDVRAAVRSEAIGHGVPLTRLDDIVLALNEVVTNSIRYGGGGGTLEMWSDGRSFVCQVRDEGRLADPLVGRHEPSHGLGGGRGIWLVHHFSDLVQIRSGAEGTTVRLHYEILS